MNLALDVTSQTEPAVLSDVLARWYATHASVRRLQAIEEHAELVVVLTLEPTSDGDDTLPVWFARSSEWRADLRAITQRDVRLQLSAVDDSPVRSSTECVVELDWRTT